MHRQDNRTILTAQGVLAAFYPVPKPWDTEEQRVKFHHLDLDWFSPSDLALESDRLKLRLIAEDECSPDYPWLAERWSVIQEALRKQKGRAYGRS